MGYTNKKDWLFPAVILVLVVLTSLPLSFLRTRSQEVKATTLSQEAQIAQTYLKGEGGIRADQAWWLGYYATTIEFGHTLQLVAGELNMEDEKELREKLSRNNAILVYSPEVPTATPPMEIVVGE